MHSKHLHTVQAGRNIDPMKATVEVLRRNKVYTLKDVAEVMPWAKNGRTVRKILEADKKGPNLLHCKITGTASQRRYLVEGRHLINYIKNYGPALMSTVRKPKQKYVRNKSKSAGSREGSKAR